MGPAKVILSSCISNHVTLCFAHLSGFLALRGEADPCPAHRVWGDPAGPPPPASCSRHAPHLSPPPSHTDLLGAPRGDHAATHQKASLPSAVPSLGQFSPVARVSFPSSLLLHYPSEQWSDSCILTEFIAVYPCLILNSLKAETMVCGYDIE